LTLDQQKIGSTFRELYNKHDRHLVLAIERSVQHLDIEDLIKFVKGVKVEKNKVIFLVKYDFILNTIFETVQKFSGEGLDFVVQVHR